MFRCIVIDDEPHAIEALKKYIDSVPNLDLIATFTDPYLALVEMESIKDVDLILLDIDMPRISGIELARSIRGRTRHLIFTTGHTKYGYEAFKADADDYLLKPFTMGEFILSINKILPEQITTKTDANASFLVKNKEEHNRIISVKFSTVIAVESKLNYVMIYTTEKKITVYMTLGEIHNILDHSRGFFQFHRSFIISHNFIDYIEGNLIKMKNDLVITVREFHREKFNEFLAKHLVKSKPKIKIGPEK